MMVKVLYGLIFGFVLSTALFPACRAGADESKSALIGNSIFNFSLPSAQDRLVNYGRDYYGRFNLIITFFPAAFTPV
jgi:hypothetical protein